MKKLIKKIYNKLKSSKLSIILKPVLNFVFYCEYHIKCIIWRIKGAKMPSKNDIELVKENVTFIYKSFERQNMAKQLYKNIQKYYPGVKVIIADDSETPLKIKGDSLEIVNLPFNSGLSYGINRALEKVTTPYLVRLDDDELLTPTTRFHEHLKFLTEHPEADLVAVLYVNALRKNDLKKTADNYFRQTLSNAPKTLLIPHLTRLDKNRIVVAKPPQIFIARTDAVRKVGYDDNIRMIDHNDFFFRAVGNIVSVLDTASFVYHRHNMFDGNYGKYRNNYARDLEYLKNKHLLLIAEAKKNQKSDT